mgnify:CR=1 FL=1
MSTLTNQQINATYQGLVKTTDNAAIDATPKRLEDGVGNQLPIEVATNRINMYDTVDFSGATVTGLAAGGLVSGAGADSMVSAAFLTTTAAVATGDNAIALGDGASCTDLNTIAIGNGAVCNNGGGVSIGNGSSVGSNDVIAIGPGAQSNNQRSVVIGRNTSSTANNGLALGNFAKTSGFASISLATCSVQINDNKADYSVMIVPGAYGCTTADGTSNSIVIGAASSQIERTQADGAIAIGYDNQASAANSVAIGTNVLAARADTTTVRKLEIEAQGSGIVMYSPDGTAYELTVANGGTLTVTAI